MTRPARVDEEGPALITAAGGVVVHLDAGPPRFLLIRDAYHKWGLPKGHVEPGESLEAAACREVAEETGLEDVAVLTALGPIEWQFRSLGRRLRKICHFFLLRSSALATTPQGAEGITDCRWLAFEDAERLITHENARGVLRDANAWLAASPARTGSPPPTG